MADILSIAAIVSAVVIVLGIACVAVGRHCAGSRAPDGGDGVRGELPDWLECKLAQFERQALAYAIYRISLDGELSNRAREVFDSLEDKKYSRPVLLLFEARKSAGCSDRALNGYLASYISRKTGGAPEPGADLISLTQQTIWAEADEKANALQRE